MVGNPLADAWKIAKDAHAIFRPEPTEVDWYKGSGYRNDMDRLVFQEWSRRVESIRNGELYLDSDEGETRLMRWAAYFHVLGYQFLSSYLIKIFYLDLRQRRGR